MALKNISRCLASDSRITADVEFIFNVGGEKVSVPAHKVILSVASDVFEAQFYGGIQEIDREIFIPDASYKAFKYLVEYIYNIKHNWGMEDTCFLAEMYNLGEKYHLDDLKRKVLDAVADQQITKENFLDVAKLAEKHSHHHELSKKLYITSATFLKNTFRGDISEVVKLFSDIDADPTDATNSFILHKLMKTLNDLRFACLNNNHPCLCSKEPSKDTFITGARIRIVKGKHFNSGVNPYATLERLSKTKPGVFIAKKATGYISCYFGRGAYFYMCGGM